MSTVTTPPTGQPTPSSITTNSSDTESTDAFLVLSIIACVTLCFILVVCSLIYFKMHRHKHDMMSLSLSNHRKTTDTNPSNDHKNSITNITKPENDTINIKVTSNNNQIPAVHHTPSLPPLPKQMTTTATVTLCDTITQTPPGLNEQRSQTNKESEGLHRTNTDTAIDITFMEPIHESISLKDQNPTQLISNNSNSDDIYEQAAVIPTANGSGSNINNEKHEIMQWLNTLNLSKYYNNFIINGYDSLEYIKEIQKTKELNDIKITKFVDQITIMNAIKQLKPSDIDVKDEEKDDEKAIELSANSLSDDMYEIKCDMTAAPANTTTVTGEQLIEDDDAKESLIQLDENDSLSDDMYNNFKMNSNTKGATPAVENNNVNNVNNNVYNKPYVHGVQSVSLQMSEVQFDTTEMKYNSNDNMTVESYNERIQFIDKSVISPTVSDKIYVMPNVYAVRSVSPISVQTQETAMSKPKSWNV